MNRTLMFASPGAPANPSLTRKQVGIIVAERHLHIAQFLAGDHELLSIPLERLRYSKFSQE